MRLSGRIKGMILQSIENSFGSERIYLFGSRTDDTLRGGDIDIAIESSMPLAIFRRKRALFYTNLLRKGYDLKVDLIQYSPQMDLLFKKEIDNNKILLERFR